MTIMIEKEYVDAVHYLNNLIEDKVICNSNRDKGAVESRTSLRVTDIKAAYLILVFTKSNNIDVIKWKISFNDVILTRELKPHIEKTINDKFTQTVFVYDVSKIMTKDEASIKISCTAKGYVYLDGVTLLTIAQYKGFHTYVACEVNPYVMSNTISKTYNMTPSFDINEAIIYLGLIASTPSWIKIKSCHGDVFNTNIPKGYNIIEATIDKDFLSNIQIHSEPPQIRHIFSCIMLRHANYPDIVVDNISFTSSSIKLKLRNIGSSANDSLELLVLRYGIPIYRVSLPQLKPYEDIEYEISLGSINKQIGFRPNNITIRIIWSKAYRIFERDVPIK